MFSNWNASGEGDEFDVGIGDHFLPDLAGPPGHYREHFGRQSGLIEHIREQQRSQWSDFGGLADHAVVGSDGRGNLVSNHIHRMIERRDSGDRLQWITLGINAPLFAVGRKIARENLAIVDNAQLPRQAEHIKRASHLVKRVLFRNSQFCGNEIRDFITARCQDLGGTQKNLLARITGQRWGIRRGDIKRPDNIFPGRARYRTHHTVVPGINDLDTLIPVGLLTANSQGFMDGSFGYCGDIIHELPSRA